MSQIRIVRTSCGFLLVAQLCRVHATFSHLLHTSLPFSFLFVTFCLHAAISISDEQNINQKPCWSGQDGHRVWDNFTCGRNREDSASSSCDFCGQLSTVGRDEGRENQQKTVKRLPKSLINTN